MRSSLDLTHDAGAFAKAVDLLALRPHFRAELAVKLGLRGFESSAVDAVLSRLIDLGYVDDLKAARGFAAQRVTRQSWGPRRLIAELSRRGVDEGVVQAVLKETFAEGEEALAAAAATRWVGKRGRDRDRLARYLDRRGFSKGVIVEILGEFAAEPKERP